MGFEVQQSRINMYALLSRMLLIEADEKLVDIICNDPVMSEFFPSFVAWKNSSNLDTQTIVNEHLSVDFATTFFVYLTPYESFYTREDGMINTGSENETVKFYTSYGFEVELEQARTLSPDHIGIELEFMAKLVEEEKKAREEGDNAYAHRILLVQLQFLKEHLLVWAPQFLLQVAKHAKNPFYREAGQVALEMILGDYEYCLAQTVQG
jgi:TorA maturation chaperone TorD